ncbi:MAG: hypothetical protein SF053_21835 [Bacteroidia bacterium]|nr:hypothetical protein [Bacteroidia bacterium]
MLKQPFIYKDAPLSDSENYEFLRQEGLKRIEQLASDLWTDYNTHDPGITLLEALCYAITDLGYRTQFEIRDLLTRSDKGATYTTGRFHTAAEVMSCYPVTFDDLRQVLIDIRGVRNAWVYPVNEAAYRSENCDIDPLTPAEAQAEWDSRHNAENPVTDEKVFFLGGLYEVCIEYDEFVQEMRTGVLDLACISAGQGNYIQPEGQGISFEISQDIVLRTVSVYAADPDPVKVKNPDGSLQKSPGTPVPVTISLLDGEGQTIRTWQKMITTPHTRTVLELDHTFTYEANRCTRSASANCYTLTAEGPEGCLWLFAHHETGFPFELPGYVTLTEGSPDPDTYYFLYDWVWDTAETEDTLGKWYQGRVGEPDDSHFLSEYITPGEEAIVFDAEKNFILDAVYLFVNRPGQVTILLQNDRGETLRSEAFHIPQTLCKKRIPLCWEIPACRGYRLTARTEAGVELALNRGARFPYDISGEAVIQLIGGHNGTRLEQIYPFLYDWEISWRSPETGELDDYSLTKGRVRREVWHRLHAYRNLCEDPIRVKEVKTEEIGIDAEIILTAGAQVDEVHAEILCRLEEHIKPPVHFYTLSQMLERGYSTDEIFTGPLLEHGFIDPAEFAVATDRTELRTSDVINLLMDIPGVQSVKKVRLESYRNGVLYKQDPWFLCLTDGTCWKPNFTATRSCFAFFQNRIVLRSDRREVTALLEEKRLRLRPVKLKGTQRDLPVPVGDDREPGAFWPAQHDLPGVYRTGRYQVPDSQSSLRKAQSQQLKGYLMFFEQILANYLAQLDNLHHLFSWEPLPRVRTYFTQRATEGVEGASQLYIDYQNLTQQLDQIIELPGPALERRNRFLDHLTARFAEQFTDYSLLMFQLFDGKETALAKVIRDKELFLAHYPTLSSERARGFNYRLPDRTLAGYQRRVMSLLGMYPRQPGDLPAPVSYRLQHEPGQGWRFVIESQPGQFLFISRFTDHPALVAGLFDLMLTQGISAENYRLITLAEGDCEQAAWELAGPCTSESPLPIGHIPVGETAARDSLIGWITQYEAPTPVPVTATDRWPDLAHDYFRILADANGWHVIITEGEKVLFRSRACTREAAAEQILDAAIRLGSDRSHYRLDVAHCRWDLLNDCHDGREPEVIGHTTSLEALHRVIMLFQQALEAEGLHVVEHILLRPRSAGDTRLRQLPGYPEGQTPPVGQDLYTFQATVLMPAWPRRSGSLAFRRLAEDTLRRETPAHVYLHIIWITFAEMRRFERAWTRALDALGALAPMYAGIPPLAGAAELADWTAALTELIRKTECLHTTYPPARLYDPLAPHQGEVPMLGQMSLKSM